MQLAADAGRFTHPATATNGSAAGRDSSTVNDVGAPDDCHCTFTGTLATTFAQATGARSVRPIGGGGGTVAPTLTPTWRTRVKPWPISTIAKPVPLGSIAMWMGYPSRVGSARPSPFDGGGNTVPMLSVKPAI